MTMAVPPRYRLPVAIAASVAVVLTVLVAVLIANGGNVNPGPSPIASASASASASSDPTSTPEGVVRAFFDAYAKAGQTDDPAGLEPFVTGRTSSAYLSAAGFLQGQKEKGKASVTTVLRLDNMTAKTSADGTATVTFDYTEGGYNIDPATGSPLESPMVLPATKVAVTVRQIGGRWLVDAYQSQVP
ncbi:MAG: hypothetical protein ACYDAN_12140 [Candidatus Limnocylindrales bacterium]